MPSGFYIKRGEKEQGPFSSKDLKAFAASGKLRKTDKIRKEDSQKYYPADSVKGLFSAEAPAKKQRPMQKAKNKSGGTEIGSPSDFETSDDEDFADAVGFDDVEYADEFGEEDDFGDVEEYEPEPPRKRRSRGPAGPPPPRRSPKGKKASSTGKPKKRKPAKKAAGGDDDDEDEDGPWANLFYGVCCIAGGIVLFIVLGEGPHDDWGRRGGLVKLILQALYYVGGRWAVLVIMILFGLVLFWAAFEQFKKQASG